MNSEQRKQILIIDDDPIVLATLTNMLSPMYRLKTATNAETGLLMAHEQEIDLILLDIIMKNMSGFEVLSRLKSSNNTKNIPVIFITGMESSGDEVKALSSGAVDYIRKPLIADIVILRIGIHMKLIAQMRLIERFSLTDGLTGVNNRRCFDRQLEKEWSRAARNGGWLSMMMLDIDNFKAFNDKYGHLNGDSALKTVATVLTSTVLRGTDNVYRWGGEEFAVILSETQLEGALIVAEKIRANVAATPVLCGSTRINITVSIGVSSIIPSPASYPSQTAGFCEELDRALYRAKDSGRNRIVSTIKESK